MIIVDNARRLEVGKFAKGLSGPTYNVEPNQPFVVLREATKEEYLADIAKSGTYLNSNQLALLDLERYKYYEISTD